MIFGEVQSLSCAINGGTVGGVTLFYPLVGTFLFSGSLGVTRASDPSLFLAVTDRFSLCFLNINLGILYEKGYG